MEIKLTSLMLKLAYQQVPFISISLAFIRRKLMLLTFVRMGHFKDSC